MIAPQIGIAFHSSLLRCGQVEVAPDREVEEVERLWMKQTDEVDDHDVAEWDGLELPKSPDAPVEAAKAAG